MKNKEEELEALARSQRFDIIGISETWWDEFCDWSALLDGYRLFRTDRQSRRSKGVAMYVIEGLECMEVTAGNGTVENLWVKIKWQTNNADVIVEVYYRPSSQDDHANELFFEELRDTSKSTALVLMGDLNLPEINWEHYTTDTTQAIRFLKNWMTILWNRF
ncbi:mitochondrial fission process protein 1 [Pitangus sulphuratus]|nr:mitochondrial fission process protein 1 [Pitangus sulphuratus]